VLGFSGSKEANMRKLLILAAAAVVMISAAALVMDFTATSASQVSQSSFSAFDLMMNAKNLPVAPHVDAF
jgi:hypothetical protein